MNAAHMTNTPGYYYAIAYWLACMLFISQTNKRVTGKLRWSVQIFFLLVIIICMVLTADIPVAFFIPVTLFIVFLMLLFIYICCDFYIFDAGYYCARAFILGEFVASFNWQICYYALQHLNVLAKVTVNALLMILIYILVYGIMYFIEKRLKKENQNLHVTKHELLYVVIISAAVYMMSNLSYVYEDTPFSSRFSTEIFNIRTLVDLGGVAFLLAYHVQLGELHMIFEVEKLQNILDMQYANYQMSEKSIEIVNQEYHDLKYQIALLRSGVASKESAEYLDRMENEIKVYEAQNKTGNKILDAILTWKILYCQNFGINLTCVADGAVLEFLDAMDISTLFGNALDNAIECVKKLADEEKRLIHLTVTRQREFLRILVENYYEDNLVFENGLPATTKDDKIHHGYGLKSIQNTVKKYDGSVTINAQENWFELRILIPIPNM
jgi:hypothetical protein